MRVYFAVLFVLAAPLPASAEVVQAANLNEAVEDVPCEHFRKNENGSWSLADVKMQADRKSAERLIIADPRQVEILDKRCSKP
jgi:hypothetical protein